VEGAIDDYLGFQGMRFLCTKIVVGRCEGWEQVSKSCAV
jgi:hypothetical protein